jgi:pilus assembly protein CpaB
MNSRFLTLFIIALVLAAAAAVIAKRWVQSLNQAPTAEQNMMQVYVASANIPYAARIEQTHYKLVNWPKENVPPEAFTEADTKTNPNILIGKVAQREFYAGEVLLKPQIKEHLGGSTLSALIKEGMRAISVRVDDVAGVAGFILPGNKADIIASKGSKGETYTLLKNIKILAIDQTASTDKDTPAVVRALTLEVTPKQAETLVHAMQSGTLQFTLRNPMDTSSPPVDPVLPVSASPDQNEAPKKPALSVNILPWSSQKFVKCQEEESC